jgi:hypothetical protein
VFGFPAKVAGEPICKATHLQDVTSLENNSGAAAPLRDAAAPQYFKTLNLPKQGLSVYAIVLNACCAQACQTMPVDGTLPAEIFLNRQLISPACFFEAEQTTANGGDNFCLATDNPTMGARRRQISNRKRTAIWTDDVIYTGTQLT